MKILRNAYSFALLLLVSALLSNCKSDLKTEAVPVDTAKDKYLVSYNVVRPMTASDVNTLYIPVQFLYPDVSDILPYIKSGAKVYSITYNTTLGTKKLVASGLVTIPDGGGRNKLSFIDITFCKCSQFGSTFNICTKNITS